MHRRARGHEEGWLLSYADLITNLLLFFVVLLSAANLSKGKMQQIAKSISGEDAPESLESIKKEIDKQITEQKLNDLVTTKLLDDGLDMSFNSGLVFDPGKADIKAAFEPALASMLGLLGPYSKTYRIAVEGHTDATPLAAGGTYKSNWDLSTARAIVVRDRLEASGITANRIRVEGYADTKPLPDAELAGLETDAKNARLRRVVVRIY